MRLIRVVPAKAPQIQSEKRKDDIMSVPNILTILRIIFTPIFLILIIQQKLQKAFIVFLLAGFTDVLDGAIARFFDQKTNLGIYLDPAADKLLISSSYILLSLHSVGIPNTIPVWLTFIVIGRDVLIAFGFLIFFRLNRTKDLLPSLLGKATTVSQVTVVGLVLLFNIMQISPPVLNLAYLITLILTILSGVDYSLSKIRLLSSPK
ncbi:MAG: CDP-alcohol phosphatidyltransferase family protein [Candidatus Aminicenantes bacterium]|nr:CDP-alcohol phosphatidyltransferase family protein [Candidatus Aminicenantes bacterium]